MLERFIKIKSEREPTDIEISYRGQQVWKNFSQSLITPEEIIRIQNLHGYDIASWVLFQYFKEKESFKSFYHFVDLQKESYSKLNSEFVVIVLAHNPWEPKSKNVDYQWRMKNIVADAGFTYSYPEVSYRSSLYDAANYYRDIINRFPNKKLLFFTHGQSSLELRLLLEKNLIDTHRVLGWVSVSGLVHGTALSPASEDRLLNFKMFMNNEYPVSPEVSRSAPYALPSLKDQYGFPMVSLLAFSPTKIMTGEDQKRADDIVFWGPHDTYGTHSDFLKDEHVVWPTWGESHFIHLETYKKRLQAAFKWMILQKM